MKRVNMIPLLSMLPPISGGLTSCTHQLQERVEYIRPMYLNVEPMFSEETDCEPEDLRYYHKRCKIIYQRKDYCVTYFHQEVHKDGSSNIKILCGVQNGPSKVEIEGR